MSRTRRHRHSRRQIHIFAVLLCTTLAGVNPAWSQTEEAEITVAFFAPSVYFDDSVARAGFISNLARQIENEIGVPVRGTNTSSARDLGNADFAIVDGQYFAGTDPGVPILSASSDGNTAKRLALIVASGGPGRLSDLRGSTLILPRVGDQLESFVSAEILRGEIDAADFFGDIQFTSNIESALSAVTSGRADATVAFADYAERAGLEALDRYSEAPLPVVVQLNDSLSDETVEAVRAALRRANGNAEIRSFASFDRDAVSSFQRAARRERPQRNPLMTPARTVTIPLGDVELPDAEEALPVPSPIGLFVVPPMEEQ